VTPSPTSIFFPESSVARMVFDLSLLVYVVCGVIFAVVSALLIYALVKYRKREGDETREPAQIFGSKQIELAWTIIPIIIVLVLFLSSVRVIAATQDAKLPPGTIEVNVVGHQYWWEYRYPGMGVVTANELHIPTSDPAKPTPTLLHLYSADANHSYWVPRLAGKTDLIPNHPNQMWVDPEKPGLYLGQCAQYCGIQHAKMLLRVYVHSPADFRRWLEEQRQPARQVDTVARGREIFERTTCMNCHTIAGTPSTGRFGPDLTHLMSRDTLAAGIVPNNRDNLRAWIKNPDSLKPGSLMPAIAFDDAELDAVTDYLMTLR
jgi:cytochrome c oxidase subunit 2